MLHKRHFITTVLFLLLASLVRAQDGLNLPTELYTLTNSGEVQRYGVGIAGLTTVTPEGEFVLDFGVAPDGNWLAYRTESALTLLNMFTGSSQVLETGTAGVPSVRGRGDTMAWSPSGDALAYTNLLGGRVYFGGETPTFVTLHESVFVSFLWSPGGDYLAAEADQNIWWLYRREGSQMVLTSAIPSSVGLAWFSPTEAVFAPATGGLLLMDLGNRNAQATLLDNTWVCALPTLRSDGSLVTFARSTSDNRVPEGSGVLVAFSPVDKQPDQEGTSAVDLTGLRWAPGGQLAIAFRGGVLALVLPITGEGITLPASDTVAYSWGPLPPATAAGLNIPANGYFLTSDTNGIQQVWRLPRDGSLPELVTTAEVDITLYTVAPGQNAVAYVSGGQVWLQTLRSAETVALAEIGTHEVRFITFSPNGQQIAYNTLGSADDPVGGIWLVSNKGGDAELVLKSGGADAAAPGMPPFYREPQFAQNLNALLAVEAQSELTSYIIFDLNTKEALNIGNYDTAMWLNNGRILAYGNGVGIGDPPATRELVIINPADLVHTQLASIPSPSRVLSMQEISASTVRLVLGNDLPGPHALSVVDLNTQTGALTPVGNGGFVSDPELSPDGKFIAGQTHTNGQLTFRATETNQQTVIADPPNLAQFEWGE